MNILVVVLWVLANGQPTGANTFGMTDSVANCQRLAASALIANQAQVEQMMQTKGVTPKLLCVDIEDSKVVTEPFPNKYNGPVTKL